MEELKNKSAAENDREIVFSNTIKAGKRIYYLDVKKNRKDEMFLAITESKKVVSGEGDDSKVSFEKHKIFLYREDFDKFAEGLQNAMLFIKREQGEAEPRHYDEQEDAKSVSGGVDAEPDTDLGGEIKINLDF